MKKILLCGLSLTITLLPFSTGFGYSHANRYGGSTSHSYGSTSHDSAYGTSSSHTYGEGSSHTNEYGGSTSHNYDGGTSHTNAYGGTTTGEYGAGAVHTTPYGTSTYGSAYHPTTAYPAGYYGYHPPAAVPYYGSTCYNCGGSAWGAAAAGAVVGATVTAAAVSSANSANTAAAYNQGYTAGATNTAASYTMGQTVAVLPGGCITPSVPGGGTYATSAVTRGSARRTVRTACTTA